MLVAYARWVTSHQWYCVAFHWPLNCECKTLSRPAKAEPEGCTRRAPHPPTPKIFPKRFFIICFCIYQWLYLRTLVAPPGWRPFVYVRQSSGASPPPTPALQIFQSICATPNLKSWIRPCQQPRKYQSFALLTLLAENLRLILDQQRGVMMFSLLFALTSC